MRVRLRDARSYQAMLLVLRNGTGGGKDLLAGGKGRGEAERMGRDTGKPRRQRQRSRNKCARDGCLAHTHTLTEREMSTA